MNVKRIIRLLKLLQMLQSGTGQNAKGLARACEVSRRTVFRDIESLRLAGVPIHFEHARESYSIPSSFFLPPTNFTAAEALSVIAMTTQMGRRNQLSFYEPAHTAAIKLERSLPPKLREELRRMTQAIRIQLPHVNRHLGKETIYQQLVDASAARQVVRIVYDSLTEWDRITTRLRPYHLLFSHHSWYVIGRSSMHREVRTFKLSRIATLEKTDERFRLPSKFSVERYLGNAWHLIPEPGPDLSVWLRFKPLVAQNVSEVHWHKTQQIQFLEDGSLDFRATVSGINEISWWILGYGDQVEVKQPTRLRRLVAQRARNVIKMYPEVNGEPTSPT
jgi:proteasome accessory factor B